MKNLITFIALASSMALLGREISGRVWLDKNGDGKLDGEDKLLQGMLVSDGYGFATTDAGGAYRLKLHGQAKTIHVQRNDEYTADIGQFWHMLSGKENYDFPMANARPVNGPVNIVHCGDMESENLDYVEGIKEIIAAHPETSLIVLSGDISAGNTKGLQAHRDMVNAKSLGRPVAYSCGNHDLDFRTRWPQSPACPYLTIMGPWWESFIHGGILFVTAPIYASWEAALPYDMLDFGDYLKELCARHPGCRKALICHDIPDLTGYSVQSHSGAVNLDDEGFSTIIYAHKHINVVKKYPSGRRAFSVATPNKGGAGCFGHSIRTIRLDSMGGTSKIIYWDLKSHMAITAPSPDMVEVDEAGRLHVSVAAYGSTDEFVSVTATIGGKTLELQPSGCMAWSGWLGGHGLAPGQTSLCIAKATIPIPAKTWKQGKVLHCQKTGHPHCNGPWLCQVKLHWPSLSCWATAFLWRLQMTQKAKKAAFAQ